MSSRLIIISGFLVLMSTIMLTPTFAVETSESITTYDEFQLKEIQITLHVPADNILPWGTVYGTIKDHAENHPVIIQIYKDGDPIHFAQTDVNDDGSYEYKFRVRSVDNDRVINVFEGDYDVKVFQAVKLKSELSI